MTRKFTVITLLAFFLTALAIGGLRHFPSLFAEKKSKEILPTRMIIPQEGEEVFRGEESEAERMAREEQLSLKAPLEEGEALITALTGDFDGDSREEQFIVYRNLNGADNPVCAAFIDYDDAQKQYRRVWSAPAAQAMPGTISVYTEDLIGDRSLCFLIKGMNSQGEHTLTIFRKTRTGTLLTNIAEIRIDGNITVQETNRTTAYQRGLAQGESFKITAFGRDMESSNLLDQVEITYSYNPAKGLYEQSGITRIKGTQIEQQRVRELLSGKKGVFENFIKGLWYYVSPQGTLDSRQYIYFDPQNKEIIFYGEEIQQVFSWQNAHSTRYGLYVAAQNVTVTTLRRFLDIELESLDSIRVKVFEDVNLKIGVNAPWDGSYRKASSLKNEAPAPGPVKAALSAVYDSSIGRIEFSPDGAYTLRAGGEVTEGKYAFFSLGGKELLELRSGPGKGTRETFLVKAEGDASTEEKAPRPAMSLLRVRLGARGVYDLQENPITLTLSR